MIKTILAIGIFQFILEYPVIAAIILGIIGFVAYSYYQQQNRQPEDMNNPLIQTARNIMPDQDRYRFIGSNLEKATPEASYIDTGTIIPDDYVDNCVYALMYYLQYNGKRTELFESIIRLSLNNETDEISMELDSGEDQIYKLDQMPNLNFRQFKLRKKFEKRVKNFNTGDIINFNSNDIEHGVLKDIIEKHAY